MRWGKAAVIIPLLMTLTFTAAGAAGRQAEDSGASRGAAPGDQAAGNIAWVTDLEQGLAIARKTGKPVMIDFYADWCSWCRKLDSEVFAETNVARTAGRFVAVKVNTDRQPDPGKQYRVQGLPTVVFLSPDGTVIEEVVGYREPEEFLDIMNQVLHKAEAGK